MKTGKKFFENYANITNDATFNSANDSKDSSHKKKGGQICDVHSYANFKERKNPQFSSEN